MDRWIEMAWRAFWIGLGASAVLIAQSLLAPASVDGSNGPSVDTPVQAPTPAVAPILSERSCGGSPRGRC